MTSIINAKTLRTQLGEILERVRKGERFTVLYRSRPACQIVPVGDVSSLEIGPLEDDPLFGAGPLGNSRDGRSAADHDDVLYGEPG